MTKVRPIERPPPDHGAEASRHALLAHLAVLAIIVGVMLLRQAHVGAPTTRTVPETATSSTSVATTR